MDVYLVRHAAYADATYGDHGLTAAGREQAAALAAVWVNRPWTRCICSPLQRARQTAEILVAGRIPIEIDADFAEGGIGDLKGLTPDAARARFPDAFRLGHSVVARLAGCGQTAPGGEPRDAFLMRAQRACERVRAELEASRGPSLVVSHGGLLCYLLQLLVGMAPRDEVPFGFDPTGWVRVRPYREEPGFGTFPMLRFGSLSAGVQHIDAPRRIAPSSA